MHEWALAEAVLTTAKKVAEQEGIEKIAKMTIRLGELQQIEREVFEFALQAMVQEPLFQGVQIRLETEQARFRCRLCKHEWSFADLNLGEEEAEAIHFIPEMAQVYMRCPDCGTPDFEVVAGRGVWLARLTGG